MIEIYTDGSACRDGKGGLGIVAFKNNEITYTCNEKFINTTNNEMELMAILYTFVLARSNYKKDQCIIYTDSSYCVNICNDWVYSWARNNWKRKEGNEIENLSLIQSLYKYLTIDFFNCQVCKCKGHVGIIGNELADALAKGDRKRYNKIIKDNNIVDYLIKI